MALTINNARIFDGTTMSAHDTVRVVDGRIEAVGGPELVAAGDTVVEAGGATLLPGLIDAHLYLLPGTAHQAVTFGVTTGIDQFSKPEVITPVLARNHRPEVAQIRTSSIGATAPGGHPTMAYAPFPYVTGPKDAAAFVADRREEGATHLKVFYDDGSTAPMRMPSLDLPTVAALVRAAHTGGMLVVAHVTSAAAAVDVVGQGVDVLAHVPFEPLSEAQLEVLAASRVPVIATLGIADGFPGPDGTMPLLGQSRLASRLGAGWTGMLQRQGKRWMPPGAPDFAAARRNVGALHARGVPILAGTDAPNPGLVHGASLHRELQHLVAAGLSPLDALAAATSGPAAAFGLQDRGVIRPGARADLVLVAGRPDEGITATQDITAVWKQGVAVDLGGYRGSLEEETDLVALQATNEKIIAAIHQVWPQLTS